MFLIHLVVWGRMEHLSVPLITALAALLVVPALSGCLGDGPASTPSPYAGDLHTEVRGLSQSEIDDLRSGAGMGLARPAEVNGWPGPLHALELADELDLAAHQRRDLQELRDEMLAAAVPLGEEILRVHGRLEAGFRTGEMDETRLAEDLATLESLYAKLRFVHLKTHLDARPLFTQGQLDAYERLRGYGDEGPGHGGHGH